MHEWKRNLPIFIGFLFLSLLLFIFSQWRLLDNMTGLLQKSFLPLQKSTFSFLHRDQNSGEIARLRNENADLRTKLAKMKMLEKDNQALRDQFVIAVPSPKHLLPANIINMPTFVPGVSNIDEVMIDKGTDDKVKVGDYIIYKDNLVGKVVKTSLHISIVDLIYRKGISFTAKTVNTSALGINQGIGDGRMVLKNVLQTDKLEKDDLIITQEVMASDNSGHKNYLVVGKIISINKKVSDLFQSAEIKSLIDISKLNMVFVFL